MGCGMDENERMDTSRKAHLGEGRPRPCQSHVTIDFFRFFFALLLLFKNGPWSLVPSLHPSIHLPSFPPSSLLSTLPFLVQTDRPTDRHRHRRDGQVKREMPAKNTRAASAQATKVVPADENVFLFIPNLIGTEPVG